MFKYQNYKLIIINANGPGKIYLKDKDKIIIMQIRELIKREIKNQRIQQIIRKKFKKGEYNKNKKDKIYSNEKKAKKMEKAKN